MLAWLSWPGMIYLRSRINLPRTIGTWFSHYSHGKKQAPLGPGGRSGTGLSFPPIAGFTAQTKRPPYGTPERTRDIIRKDDTLSGAS